MDATAALLEDWPADDVTRVPYRVYLDPDLHAREQERIFRGATWVFVGLEAEVPHRGDYRRSWVGDTPVILTRDTEGVVHVLVNRCAHRGAEVVREQCGNGTRLRCLYHAWAYDLTGALRAVPFQAGLAGQQGYDSDFRRSDHGLHSLRVETIGGLVFATFRDETPPLREWLGTVLPLVERIYGGRPIVVLGRMRQRIRANWKLYIENVKDAYHATLLHPFFPTFGLGRSTMDGRIHADPNGVGGVYSWVGTDEDTKHHHENDDAVVTYEDSLTLSAPEVVTPRFEFGDTIGAQVLVLFPGVVLHQIGNSLGTRQIVPRNSHEFDLLWTLVGFADDDEELREKRYLHANLVGPSGFVSLEDAEALEVVQRAMSADSSAYIAMGGTDAHPDGPQRNMISEVAVRAFWQTWRSLVA
jgi:anthranilate 1,2-dioxygenase large subunit